MLLRPGFKQGQLSGQNEEKVQENKKRCEKVCAGRFSSVPLSQATQQERANIISDHLVFAAAPRASAGEVGWPNRGTLAALRRRVRPPHQAKEQILP